MDVKQHLKEYSNIRIIFLWALNSWSLVVVVTVALPRNSAGFNPHVK